MLAVQKGEHSMKTFVVPIDFSAVTEHVIETAVSLAHALDGKIVLVHVIQPPVVTSEYGLPVEALQEAMSVSEEHAAKHLARLEEQVGKRNVTATTALHHGPPVASILEEADKAGADFIVMGSHGHGKLYDLLVGSTATGVMKRAKCAVIILPPEATPVRM
jgi:nucleotide-binding universal stress UspA family protein